MKDILVPDLLLHVCDFFTEYIGAFYVDICQQNKTPKMPKKCQKIYCIKHNLNSNILYDYITHINTYTYKMKQNETK